MTTMKKLFEVTVNAAEVVEAYKEIGKVCFDIIRTHETGRRPHHTEWSNSISRAIDDGLIYSSDRLTNRSMELINLIDDFDRDAKKHLSIKSLINTQIKLSEFDKLSIQINKINDLIYRSLDGTTPLNVNYTMLKLAQHCVKNAASVAETAIEKMKISVDCEFTKMEMGINKYDSKLSSLNGRVSKLEALSKKDASDDAKRIME